jgi:hypothetical protein
VLRRGDAAAYVGLGLSLFDREVEEGRISKPVVIAGTVKCWFRRDLDAFLEDRRTAQESRDDRPNSWDSVL